jgi:DNA-binding LacI/PurR family transcriptional regulator
MLTTIEQRKKEIGISAGKIMMEALKSGKNKKLVRKEFKPRLVNGESVKNFKKAHVAICDKNQ